MVICVCLCLMDRKGRSTYCVEDIKEINYTACGCYLHRIKLLGLGNISSVKNPVWTGDTAPHPNKWWSLKINALFIPLPVEGGAPHVQKLPLWGTRDSVILSLPNWIVNHSSLGSFRGGWMLLNQHNVVEQCYVSPKKEVSMTSIYLSNPCLTGNKWNSFSKIKSNFISVFHP